MSDVFDDDFNADRIKEWIRTNGIWSISAVLVAIAGVFGWDFYSDYSAAEAEKASDLYNEYLTSQALGDPTAEIVEDLETGHGGSAYHVFTLLHQAKAAIEEEKFSDALTALKTALDEAPDPSMHDLVLIRVARVQLQLKQYEEALALLPSIKTDAYRGVAFELTGDAHKALDQLDQAAKAYQEAIEVMPEVIDSKYVKYKLATIPAPE